MDMFYKKLSLYLSENKNISKDDEELYEYAAKIVIHGIINIIVTILIGAFSGMLQECFYFFISFFVLRKFTGGLHAKKYIVCLMCSMLLMIFALFLIDLFQTNKYDNVFISSIVFSTIVIVVLSPLDNINKTLTIREKIFYKIISSFISVFLSLIVISLVVKNYNIGYQLGVSLMCCSFLLFIGKMKMILRS